MLAEAPRYRYTGQGVEWPQGCLQWALYPFVTQAISRALFIWPPYCAVSVQHRASPNFCRFSHVCLVANWLLVHTFQRLYLEGRKPSQLFSIARDWGLLPQMPISYSFPCAAPFIPYKYRVWQLCSAGAGNQFFFSLSLKCHAILSFLAWPSANSFIYVVYKYVVDTGRPRSGEWNKGYASVPMTLYVSSDLNIAKAQHPACSCKISKEKIPWNTKINEVT